jgi:hypothetical protein
VAGGRATEHERVSLVRQVMKWQEEEQLAQMRLDAAVERCRSDAVGESSISGTPNHTIRPGESDDDDDDDENRLMMMMRMMMMIMMMMISLFGQLGL